MLAEPAGTVHICREQPDGLQRETIFVHNLWLPADFIPACLDGEVVDHRLVPSPTPRDSSRNEDGPDVVTVDASLVIVDCLLRHGASAPTRRNVAALDALRRPADVSAAADAPPRAPRGATGLTCRMPISRSVSRTALTACRISSGPTAPMQPTRNVSTCVSLPG